MPFTLYVALGDSMSTDHYPTCDVRGLDLPPARLEPLGAAALLHRNARIGRDSSAPDILITLTAGGNDLLDALAAGRSVERAVGLAVRRFVELVETIREELPRASLVLTTVYDPTDDTGRLPGLESYGRLPLDQLERFNETVRSTAASLPGTLLADVHRHFLGHGVTVPERERWYWGRNLIEPNARGASEIRRLWWHAIEEAA
jgi:lysophospholipase L1-like esterase